MTDVSHLTKSGQFWKAGDLDPQDVYRLTIESAEVVLVPPFGKSEQDVEADPEIELEQKVQLTFEEDERKYDCNVTNLKTVASIADSNDTDDFAGCVVELSVRETSFGPGISLSPERRIVKKKKAKKKSKKGKKKSTNEPPF